MEQPTTDRALDDLGAEYLDLVLRTSPYVATMLGVPGYDHLVPDPSAAAVAEEERAFRDLAARAAALDGAGWSATDVTGRDVLVRNAVDAADRAALDDVEFQTAPMAVAPHAPVLAHLPKTRLTSAEQAEDYLTRLAALPASLDAAGARLLEGTAKGRTAAARSLQGSIATLDRLLDAPLADDPLLLPAHDGDGWQERREALVRDAVRPALARLRETYRALLPAARGDDRVGVGWLPGGEALYATYARTHTTTDLSPAALHQLGLDVLAGLDEEYAQLGQEVFGQSDPVAVRARLRDDPALRLRSTEELMAISQAALDRAEARLPEVFGLLPASRCALEAVPESEGVSAAPAYYTPPHAPTGRPGTYWVNPHAVTDRPRFDVEAIAFHEALPGHHLQLSVAQQLEGLPLWRRTMFSTGYSEGWGLYSERLADELGLYGTPLDRFGLLSCDSWRATRLVVDTGLHALGWSLQQALDFMAHAVPQSAEVVRAEVERYVGMPGQALAYMVGRLEIERLRREATAALGTAFSLKGFHDTVLGVGSVPLSVLDAEVQRWVAAA